MKLQHVLLFSSLAFISSCGGTKPVSPSAIMPSNNHLHSNDGSSTLNSGEIPQASMRAVALPPPKPSTKVETYSVVVTNVPAREVLFALAQDAKINIDIASGLDGYISLNAINQTLPQILDRISKQVEIRYEMVNGNLFVQPDKPYLKNYKIDFINMSRTVKNNSSTSSQLSSSSTTGSTSGNTGSLSIESSTTNNLMDSLVTNVHQILLEEDKLHYQEQVELQTANRVTARGTGFANSASSLSASGNNNTQINQANNGGQNNSGSRTGSNVSGNGDQDVQGQGNLASKKAVYERAVTVFANKESGILIVRATGRQHQIVQEFIDKVMNAAKQQVLIEATIAEVTLSDNYQQGINWSNLRLGSTGFELKQAGTGSLTATNTGSFFTAGYINPSTSVGNIAASISALQSFGTVKVLSSPKLSVMNNQTATLKVVDNKVYFEVKADTTLATATTAAVTNYTSRAIPVAVGFVMNVTPQISEAGVVTMNVKPTISRITGYVNDPNPQLATAGVTNRVPEIQTREMESIIKVDNGQIAVLGGLMQDSVEKFSDEVPLMGRIPFFGNIFKSRNETLKKSELVIFLRPVVVKDASIDADYAQFRDNLPTANFFKDGSKQNATQEKQKP